jgi:hypothetical protein
MKNKPDQLQRRCPRLGGPIEFSYCRTCEDQNRPCFKIFDCWWEFFDVVAYMREHLPKEQFDNLANKNIKPKVVSIVEMIREIQQCEKNNQ